MRKYVLAIVGLVLLCLLAALGTASGAPSTFTVNTTDDTDDSTCDVSHCSLREAINAANSNPGSTIEFSIPATDTGHEVSGITGTWTISLTSSLPTLTGGGTIISGTTQAVNQGNLNPNGPEIEISGASLSGVFCLAIESADNVVHGLVINRCPLAGVLIQKTGADYNTVSGNYIGTDALGSLDLGNTRGVDIGSGAQGNVVGGDSPEERNVISGNNQYGVYIQHDDSDRNTVSGNYIGTDATGTQDLGNTETGIVIAYGPQNNTVGGDTEGERNIISGNEGDGVSISESGTNNNTVSGNFIGTVVSGTEALGNTGDGVEIGAGAQNNTVGGDVEGERNVISANRMGVNIVGSGTMTKTMMNTVSGNYIGIDVAGSSDIGNAFYGIQISSGAHNNIVGGQTAGERNVISGNGRSGVYITLTGTDDNVVSGNYIGTDVTGTQDKGNSHDGVTIDNGAQGNTVGANNLIAHNNMSGVYVDDSGTTGNTITQNAIHSNGDLGIDLDGGSNGEISAPAVSAANACFVMGTADAGDTVEVFTGPDEEGKTYLATALAGGAGQWSVVGSFTFDTYVTATATDASGNTSEFSSQAEPGACYPVYLPLGVKSY